MDCYAIARSNLISALPFLITIGGWLWNERSKRKHEIRMARAKWYEHALNVFDDLNGKLMNKSCSIEDCQKASDSVNGLTLWASEKVFKASTKLLEIIVKLSDAYINHIIPTEFDKLVEDYRQSVIQLTMAMRKDLKVKPAYLEIEFLKNKKEGQNS